MDTNPLTYYLLANEFSKEYVVLKAELGKPVWLSFFSRSRAEVIPTDGYAGKGCRNKRTPCCNGEDRSCDL